MRNLTKKLLFSTAAVAAVAFATPAFAQQKGDAAGTWYEEQIEEPAPLTKKQVRQQMLADQRTISLMQQHATGEYAARPTSRFPNFMTYQPSISGVYYARPNRWYRAPYSIDWY